jgi:NADH-quinone oxidoreductase subunit J
LPSPGVFARHNAVDTPALLPDGTASELSVSPTLRARGTVADARELSAPIERTLREIEGADDEPGSDVSRNVGQSRAGGGSDQ